MALFVGLVIGLIKPRWVLPWSKKPNRWKVFGWFVVLFLVLGIVGSQFENNIPSTEKQNEKGVNTKRDWLQEELRQRFEIISLHLPDSVVFKPLTSPVSFEPGSLNVYLVSGTDTIRAGKVSVGGKLVLGTKVSVGDNKKVETKVAVLCTDSTEITAKKFKIPAGFQAQKIKFTIDKDRNIDERTEYYDIEKNNWE